MRKRLELLAFLVIERALVRLAFPDTTREQRRVLRVALRKVASASVAVTAAPAEYS